MKFLKLFCVSKGYQEDVLEEKGSQKKDTVPQLLGTPWIQLLATITGN